MYGLVNKAIADLISMQHGDRVWAEVRRRAGVNVDDFVGMEPYPDAVTYDLVRAASELLDVSADKLLEAFGEYWILYTARQGYGDLLGMGGRTFREFMLHLHDLHTHVGLAFPDLRPPSFWCSDVGEDTLTLHYQSERDGLAPMVVGLLRGLGTMFDTEVTVEHVQRRAAGAAHDEFAIGYRARE
jgi:hypothetical protein